MPVAEGSRSPARQAVLVGLGAVLGVLAVVFLVTRVDQLTADEDTDVPVGQPVFAVGNAAELADLIDRDAPLLLPDAARGERDIWLNHLGESERRGWVAFAVRPPDADRECFVEWEPEERVFVDRCDGTIYPEDGAGLPQYAVSVDPDGDLVINLDPIE